MPIVTHPAIRTTSEAPLVAKQNRLARVADAHGQPRTRMYLEAVTDPKTGLVDPVREEQLLRIMAL